MRISNAEHRAHPWLIERIAPDFRLLDVWSIPVEGTRDEFASFVATMTSFDPSSAGPSLSRALFRVRLRIGTILGWDEHKERPIPGCTETTLRARLTDDLQRATEVTLVRKPHAGKATFTPLYLTTDEFAAEISNETVHGVLHLGWVEDGEGHFRPQMGIYVKPRGVLGEIYLKAIQPFRHVIVYPALTRQIERRWNARSAAVAP